MSAECRGKKSLFVLVCAIVSCGGSALVLSLVSRAADPSPGAPAVAAPAVVNTVAAAAVVNTVAAAKVKGAESCKKCHESEHTAWTRSMHFKNHERITSSAGRGYAQKMGGTATCQSCHSTPNTPAATLVESVGVSCESCHTPAGDPNGWFDIHSNYGGENLKIGDETQAHLKQRLADCDASGMIRAENTYELAKNCYSCHIVADDKLLKAGHKPGHADFDLIAWMHGEVRHNFQVNQKANAESPSLLKARTGVTAEQRKRILLVVGEIVELETCLRSLAAIQGPLSAAAGRKGWADRAEDAYDYLAEDISAATDNEHVKAAVAAVKGIALGRRFKDQAGAEVAADSLAKVAKAFAAEAGTAKLDGLDKLVKKHDRPKGTPYTP